MNKKNKLSCGILGCIIRFHVKRHFFRFPKAYERWLKWVQACKRFDLLDKGPQYSSENVRLCHLHFEKKLYRTNKFRARLHSDAVPTLLLGPNTKQNDNTNEVTEQNVSSEEEEEEEELHSNIYTEEAIKFEEENNNTYAEGVIKVEENSNTYAEGAIKVEEENSNICTEEFIKIEAEDSNIYTEEPIKIEEEYGTICAEEVIKIGEENSNGETSEIILPTYHSAASNLEIEIKKLGISAENPGNVTSCTKELLDDTLTETGFLKLRKQVKKLEAKIKTLRETIRRLRMKERKRKQVVTSTQTKYSNLRELGRKLLPENFNRILAAQIDAQFKSKHGRRYDPQFKKFASSLFFLSPQNYKELEKLLALPSIRTLQLFTEKSNS